MKTKNTNYAPSWIPLGGCGGKRLNLFNRKSGAGRFFAGKLSEKDREYFRVTPGAVFAGLGASVFVFVLYLMTLAPGVLYYDRPLLLDSVMLQTQAITLGITGPTGEPSWVMLTHMFTYLPFGSPAYLTNLSSAVYSALAVLMVFVAGLLLSQRIIAALAAALAFGLGSIFWSQAVITEIYTLNALLILLPIISLLVWRERRKDRYLLLAAFLMGFALTNHLTSGLVIPAGFIFVAITDWRKLTDMRLVLKGAGLFLLGLVPYLYLPIRASMNPPMNEADPSTWSNFWYFVKGGGHHKNSFAFGPSEIPERLGLYWSYLVGDFNLVLLAIAVVGAVSLVIQDRAAAAMIIPAYLMWTFHAIEYKIFDVELYFIPSFLMLALLLAFGFSVLLRAVERISKRLPVVKRGIFLAFTSTVLVLLPLYGVWDTYSKNDMSDADRGRKIIDTVASKARPDSTIIHHRSSLWYMVLIEERRQDLTIIDPWRPDWDRHTDIVWPDDIDAATTERRYGVGGFAGVNPARKSAEYGPVYILDQEGNDFPSFYDAGFRTLHVEGALYRLIPPGESVPAGSEGSLVKLLEE